jgi:hypothetical protein
MCRGRGRFFAIRLVARSASGTKDFEGSATCIPYARCAIVSVAKAVCARSALSSSKGAHSVVIYMIPLIFFLAIAFVVRLTASTDNF